MNFLNATFPRNISQFKQGNLTFNRVISTCIISLLRRARVFMCANFPSCTPRDLMPFMLNERLRDPSRLMKTNPGQIATKTCLYQSNKIVSSFRGDER